MCCPSWQQRAQPANSRIAARVGEKRRSRIVYGASHGSSATTPPRQEVEVYDYQDASGNVVYQVVRFEPKDFRQRRMVEGQSIWNMDGVTRVLYRLPEVLKAGIVWIVEGEKDAEALCALVHVATCNVGGAGKWQDSYSESLRGKDVILCGDNDEPGQRHMTKVEAALQGIARSIRRVTVPEEVKDISEHLKGLSDSEAQAALEELLRAAVDLSKIDPYRCTDWLDFSAEQEKEPEPSELIRGILHRGSKLVLGGSSKSNKTWSLLDMAISVASGKMWWGMSTTKGPVVYVDMELSKKQLFKRVTKILETRGVTLTRGDLHLISLRGHVSNAARTVDKIRTSSPAGMVLIVLDPIYKFNAGRDENSAGDIGEMLNTLESLAVETGAAVAYAAHYSKGNQARKESIDRISGSGVYARDADSLVMMTRHEEGDCFTIEPTVRNFAPAAPFVMRWNFPLMERDDTLDPSKLKQSGGRPVQHHEKELLALVQKPVSGQEWERLALEVGIGRSTYFNLRRQLVKSERVIQMDGSKLFSRRDAVQ